MVEHFGKLRRVDDLTPDDFQQLRVAMGERLGVVARSNEINRVRIVFKFA